MRPKQKNRKINRQTINIIILILHFVFPVWLIALMYTPSISGILFFAALFSLILLDVVYLLVQKHNKGRRYLYAARAVAVCALTAFYLPTVLLMSFSHSKLLYTLKRFDYIYGVYGNDYYEQLLPEKLPDVCEDYSFRTYGDMPAPDYRAPSYLVFHTDSAVLDRYAEHFDKLECVRYENGTDTGYEDGRDAEYVREWVCEKMRLRESYQDNLDHAVLYWFDGKYPQAVLLNYETGLVAIMT